MKKIALIVTLTLTSFTLSCEEGGIGMGNMKNISRVIQIFFEGVELPISTDDGVRTQYGVKILQAPSGRHDGPMLETWMAISGEGFYSDMYNLGDLGKCFKADFIESDVLLIWCGDINKPKDMAVTIKRRENIIYVSVDK